MIKKLLLVFIVLVLLTGCWDERQFKNVKLVLAMGFDLNEEGLIHKTVSIPSIRRGSEGPGEETIQIVSTDAASPHQARERIDEQISESFDPSKAKVIVVGEDLAKKNIYPVLDEFYRNPNRNLNAYLAVARGQAADVIGLKSSSDSRISNYISGLLQGAVASSHATGENLQMICAELIEPGEDFSIPLISADQEKGLLKFEGMGLFHEDHYSGVDIPQDLSTIFMLLQGRENRIAKLTIKVSDNDDKLMNYITINVMKLKQDFKINVDGDEVDAEIDLDLKVRVVEYASNHLMENGKIDKLNEKISEVLTKDAEKVISLMQEANSDIFAVGRKVKAYHPDVYNKLDWKEYYPTMSYKTKVKVQILEHGIIN
ncbi:Ger(x)C family spore germination protein [Halobacillus sp. BBL2006]|uniref:Ger(x)C family spore germination protein n=1 Tax=Halobacillus sp. BBL2006 TaxID=1543706 RepID=UPI000543B956|nr:Ger(x)C family spore germination protein [Halobacillus sp. BBL2006]KHE68027.1 spore gernimation protein [Halobacillus sp. BBL2006]